MLLYLGLLNRQFLCLESWQGAHLRPHEKGHWRKRSSTVAPYVYPLSMRLSLSYSVCLTLYSSPQSSCVSVWLSYRMQQCFCTWHYLCDYLDTSPSSLFLSKSECDLFSESPRYVFWFILLTKSACSRLYALPKFLLVYERPECAGSRPFTTGLLLTLKQTCLSLCCAPY